MIKKLNELQETNNDLLTELLQKGKGEQVNFKMWASPTF